jgi:hypothetical protein
MLESMCQLEELLMYCLEIEFQQFLFCKIPRNQGDFSEVGFGTWQSTLP